MQAHLISPHDIIEVTGHDRQYFYRVHGVYIGGLKSVGVVTLESVNEAPPWFGEETHTMAVPIILLEAGLSNGTFIHLKKGPYPAN